MKKFYVFFLLTLAINFITFSQEKNTLSERYYTYSQDFYGNYGSKTIDGLNIDDFIYSLLDEDLVVGGGSNTLTVSNDAVECIIDWLPGGGPSNQLNGPASCASQVSIDLVNGRFNNSLLAQTITLGLNLRFDHKLGDLVLEGSKFKTWKVKDPSNPYSGKKGKANTFYLSQPVLDYLGEQNTVADLYALANEALAGNNIGELQIWEITSAVTVINHGFSGGRILKGFYTHEKEAKVDFSDQDMFIMRIYPNPIRIKGAIEFTTMETGETRIELYNYNGQLMDVLMDEVVSEFTPIRAEINALNYAKGMYILYIQNGENIVKEKIAIVK